MSCAFDAVLIGEIVQALWICDAFSTNCMYENGDAMLFLHSFYMKNICVLQGVLLTPSYSAMNLSGSEYWTHFLPNRVGEKVSRDLVTDSNPILAATANDIGLVDYIIGK